MSTTVQIPTAAVRSPGQEQDPEIANPVRLVGLVFCYAYLLICIGRLTEVLQVVAGHSFRIVLITMAGALVTCVATGSLLRVISSRIGFMMMLVTGWFLCAVPTSVHKGGSVAMLRDNWLPVLVGFVVVAGLVMTLQEVRRALQMIAMATVLIIVLGRYHQMVSGTLANPNLLGQQLLYGLPFCILPAIRHGLFSVRGIGALGLGVVVIFAVVGTGSRAALVTIGIMIVVSFFMVSLGNKVKLLLFTSPVIILALVYSSSSALTRYSTLFSRVDLSDLEQMDPESIGETLSAMESSRARRLHLVQSIDLTMKNPVFGVGPGMFPVASAEDSDNRGIRAQWKETHNTYTQISSETGIIGLILYCGFLGLSLTSIVRIYRAAKRQQNQEIVGIASSMLLCFVGALTCGMFASMAYAIHFPLLGALTLALTRAAERELAQPLPIPAAALPSGPATGPFIPRRTPSRSTPQGTATKPQALAAAPWRSRRYPG